MPTPQPGAAAIEIVVRARYAETDAMGVVHHASYIVWLEEGRTELFRALGLPYTAIEAAGYYVLLTDLHARYLGSARYDDRVIVRAELAELRSRQVAFGYALRHAGTGAPLLAARSEHILITRATGRPARFPAHVLAQLRQTLPSRPHAE